MWKKTIFILLVVVSTLSSCKKDEEAPIDNTPEDEYYVTYSAWHIRYYLNDLTVRVAPGNDVLITDYNSTSYNQTFGPFKKGFQAYISIDYAPYGTNAEIYVSKNNGPFALKASGEASQTYIIDF